ncbi:MAG: hypothetical protein AAF126_24670, partial [Chloroflexota bacterium]
EAYIELQENLDILRADPLFNTLNAAQNDQVYQGGPYWYVQSTIYGAHSALDDLFTYIAGVDPQEVSPNPFRNYETDIEATEEASD